MDEYAETVRQYVAASQAWQKAIEEYGPGAHNHRRDRLEQIVGNWGRFEPAQTQAAGKAATVDFRFRNGNKVSFEAREIHVGKLLADVKAYLQSNPNKLDHQKLAAIAAYDKAAAQYRSTALTAFQDVANALRALQSDADGLRTAVAAERTAAASLNLSQQQYQIGAINYLTLLNAQQTYQNAVINRVKAQGARYSDTAALFQARELNAVRV